MEEIASITKNGSSSSDATQRVC